eukprot:7383627-Prymnesium_polylepis.1
MTGSCGVCKVQSDLTVSATPSAAPPAAPLTASPALAVAPCTARPTALPADPCPPYACPTAARATPLIVPLPTASATRPPPHTASAVPPPRAAADRGRAYCWRAGDEGGDSAAAAMTTVTEEH